MTPFGIILVITAVFSTQVMQSITQPKKYRCISSRPLPQPESESTPNWVLRVPTLSVTKSSSTAPKSPATVSKSQSSVINSPSTGSKQSSVPKTSSSVSKSSSSSSKLSSSTIQKVTSATVTNSSRTANRSPPDSFSLFKLPLKLISSLLVPLLPPTIKQNTSSIISPLFSFQMPLTFSTIHHPNYLPCNTNNSPYPCNPLPGISNNIPISFNPIPDNTNNLPPIPSNPIPDNTNTLPTPCNSLPGNTNTLPTPCNSLPGNTNTTPNPSNSLPTGNKNNSINPCNSGNTNNSNNVLCNSFLGHSHKSIILNWFCNFLLNKIQNVSCDFPPTELIPTPSEPNPPATDNPNTVPTVPSDFTTDTPTEDITPNDNNPPNDNNTPSDNNTPNDDTPDDNTPPNNNIPTSTSHYPIPPCIFTPINKIHKPCLSLIHSPKPKPCVVPVTYSHYSHIPSKYYPPNHAPCSPSYAYFNSLFNPTIYKSNADHTLNPQDEILLKILKSLISNSNLR